jgi:RNA recognition motif-containing protein
LVSQICISRCDLESLDGQLLQKLRVKYKKSNVRLLSRLYSEVDGGRVWVADFPRETSEDQLLELFQSYGEVVSLKI